MCIFSELALSIKKFINTLTRLDTSTLSEYNRKIALSSIGNDGSTASTLLFFMYFSDPNFMQYWGRTVASVAPYAIPLAVITGIVARISVGFFVLKTPRN